MAINRATSSSVIATSTACRHLAMTPLLVQSQTRNPPTYLQFHGCRVHGIDRLVTGNSSMAKSSKRANGKCATVQDQKLDRGECGERLQIAAGVVPVLTTAQGGRVPDG